MGYNTNKREGNHIGSLDKTVLLEKVLSANKGFFYFLSIFMLSIKMPKHIAKKLEATKTAIIKPKSNSIGVSSLLDYLPAISTSM